MAISPPTPKAKRRPTFFQWFSKKIVVLTTCNKISGITIINTERPSRLRGK